MVSRSSLYSYLLPLAFRPTALASGLPIFLGILNSPLVKFDSPLETKFISILKSLSTWNFKVSSFFWLKLIVIFLLSCKYERVKGTIRFGVILNLISVFSGLPYILIGILLGKDMSVQGLVYWINILWLGLPFNGLYKLQQFTDVKQILAIKFAVVIIIFLTSLNDFNWLAFLTSTNVGVIYYFKPSIFDQTLNLKSQLFLKIELLRFWTNSERPYSNINLYSLLKIIKIDYLTEKEIQQQENVGHQLESQTHLNKHSLLYEENENVLEHDGNFDLEQESQPLQVPNDKVEDLEELDSVTFPLPPLVFQEAPKPRSRRGTLTNMNAHNKSPKRSRKNTSLKSEFEPSKSIPSSPKKE